MFTARGISAVGAHHTGSVGVTGSSPVCSTKFKKPIVLGFEQLVFSCIRAELVTEGVLLFVILFLILIFAVVGKIRECKFNLVIPSAVYVKNSLTSFCRYRDRHINRNP